MHNKIMAIEGRDSGPLTEQATQIFVQLLYLSALSIEYYLFFEIDGCKSAPKSS